MNNPICIKWSTTLHFSSISSLEKTKITELPLSIPLNRSAFVALDLDYIHYHYCLICTPTGYCVSMRCKKIMNNVHKEWPVVNRLCVCVQTLIQFSLLYLSFEQLKTKYMQLHHVINIIYTMIIRVRVNLIVI